MNEKRLVILNQRRANYVPRHEKILMCSQKIILFRKIKINI